jgi:hypothetical protein
MPQISTNPHGMGRDFSNINRAKWKKELQVVTAKVNIWAI